MKIPFMCAGSQISNPLRRWGRKSVPLPKDGGMNVRQYPERHRTACTAHFGSDSHHFHHMKNIKWIFFAKKLVFTRFFAPFWHFGSVTKKSRNADIFRILVGRELMSAKF